MMHLTHLKAEIESGIMESYTSLTPTDWVLSLFVTAIVVVWQLFAGSSFSSKMAGALMFGGLLLGISMHVFEWYRER